MTVIKIKKRCGFTLVELLIVVVIIAVLAGMMMMSSDDVVASAQAARIIADLTDLKAAANAYYLHNIAEVENNSSWRGLDDDAVEDKSRKSRGTEATASTSNSEYQYSFGGEIGTHWFVWCRVNENPKVRKKLVARKDIVSLCAPDGSSRPIVEENGETVSGGDTHHATASKDFTVNAHYVGMQIR